MRKNISWFGDLIIDDYMQDNVWVKSKEIIVIEKFYNTKDDKLAHYITLEMVVLLKTCVIKDDDKFYPAKKIFRRSISIIKSMGSGKSSMKFGKNWKQVIKIGDIW